MEKGRLIGQGRTAEIFQYGENKILKLYRSYMPKIAIENEYKVSMKVYKLGMSVPKVYDFIEEDNRFGIVYEQIIGQTILKLIAVKPWTITREARRLAELHKSIQKPIDADIPNFKERLKGDIKRIKSLEDNAKEKIYKYMDTLPDGNILCHGDFHPDNVMLTKEKAIIIDWMTASKGDVLADIARTSIIFKYSAVPEEKSFLEKKIISYIRNKFYSEYMKHYLSITGTNIVDIEKWELPIAAGRLGEGCNENEKKALLDLIYKKLNDL